MTCIVGLIEDDGTVWMGADSLGYAPANGQYVIKKDEKLFRVGYMLIGFAGPSRVGQLIRYSMKPPDLSDAPLSAQYDDGFEIAEAVRKCMSDGGRAEKENGVESFDGSLLVGMRGKLFAVDSGYGVMVPSERYCAIGCASGIALGALYATKGQTAEHRIRTALEAAQANDPYVREPFIIKRI